VRGAKSPDDGLLTFGIYSATARAGVILVMVEGVRGGGGEARGLVFGSRLWFVPRVCTGIPKNKCDE
jgi:hypothetical protein